GSVERLLRFGRTNGLSLADPVVKLGLERRRGWPAGDAGLPRRQRAVAIATHEAGKSNVEQSLGGPVWRRLSHTQVVRLGAGFVAVAFVELAESKPGAASRSRGGNAATIDD